MLSWKSARHWLSISLGSGLSAALVVWFLNIAVTTQRERQDDALAAIQVATDLETFADECAEIAADYDGASSRDRLKLAKHLPNLPKMHVDGGWRGFSLRERDDALSLHVKAMQAESYILSAVLYADKSDVVEVTRDEAVLLGAPAFRLAATLRREHGYPPLRVSNSFGDELIAKIPEVVKRWKAEGAPPIIDT